MPDGMFNFQSPSATGPDSHNNMNMSSAQSQMHFVPSPQHSQDGHYQSPSQHAGQMHQDSGVSFSTPSHMSQEQASMYNNSQDNGMLYQDSKVYSSPGQMHQLPDDQQMFHHHSPGQGLDMHSQQMYGFVDPHSLGQQQ
jgi:hypothetical protein